MRANKHGKSSTLLLVMLILLAGAMLVGGTFADQLNLEGTEQALPNNVNTAGMDYAVTLSYYDADAAVPGYVNVLTPHGKVTDGMFWCPGRTEIIYLKVENAEKFPVEAIVSVVASDVANVQKFDNTLSYVVFDGLKQGVELPVASWKEVTGGQTLKTGSSEIQLVQTDLLATQGNVHYLALAIHMDEHAGSKYMNAQMNLDFKLRVNANYQPGYDPANPN